MFWLSPDESESPSYVTMSKPALADSFHTQLMRVLGVVVNLLSPSQP